MNPYDIATKQDIIQLKEWIDSRLNEKHNDHERKKESLESSVSQRYLLTAKEVCNLIRISESTLRRKVKSGDITILETAPGIFRYPAGQFDF